MKRLFLLLLNLGPIAVLWCDMQAIDTCRNAVLALALLHVHEADFDSDTLGSPPVLPFRATYRAVFDVVFRVKTAASPGVYQMQMLELQKYLRDPNAAAYAAIELKLDWERYAADTPAGRLGRECKAIAEGAVLNVLRTVRSTHFRNSPDARTIAGAVQTLLTSTRDDKIDLAVGNLRPFLEQYVGQWQMAVFKKRLSDDPLEHPLHFHLIYSIWYRPHMSLGEYAPEVLSGNRKAFVKALRWAKERGKAPNMLGLMEAMKELLDRYPIRDARGKRLARFGTSHFEMCCWLVASLLSDFRDPSTRQFRAVQKIVHLLGDPRLEHLGLYNWLVHLHGYRVKEGPLNFERHLDEISEIYSTVQKLPAGYMVSMPRESKRTPHEWMQTSLDVLVTRVEGYTRPEDLLDTKGHPRSLIAGLEIKSREKPILRPSDLTPPIKATIEKLRKAIQPKGPVDDSDSFFEWPKTTVDNRPIPDSLPLANVISRRVVTIQVPWVKNDIVEDQLRHATLFLAPDGQYEVSTTIRGKTKIVKKGSLWWDLAKTLSEIDGIELLDVIRITDYDGNLIIAFCPKRPDDASDDPAAAWLPVQASGLPLEAVETEEIAP